MARSIPAFVVGSVLAVALGGCAAPAPDVETVGASPEPSSAPATTPSAPPSEEPASIDTTDWLEYATHDGDLTYRYPSDWTLESESIFFEPDADRDDVENPYRRWMDAATLIAPNGQELLQSADAIDFGGACGAPENFQPVELLASEPLAGGADLDIATVALRSVDGRYTFGMGLVGSNELPGQDTCIVRFVAGSSDGALLIGTTQDVTSGGDDPLWTVDTLGDARDYMETDEYATLREVLRSVVLS